MIDIPLSFFAPDILASYEFVIQYDNKILTPARTAKTGTATGAGDPVYDPDYQSDKIRLAWSGSDTISSDGSLAIVSFTVNKRAKSGQTFLYWDKENTFVKDNYGYDFTDELAFIDGTINISAAPSSPSGGGSGGGSVAAATDETIANEPEDLTDNEEDVLEPTGQDTAPDLVDRKVSPVENSQIIKPSDIAGHWAETGIEQLVDQGHIAGYPDGTFRPDASITRAEFTTLIVKAFGLEAKTEKVFSDTKEHWARDFIAAAAANRIVSGYDNQEFGPDEMITREQMAVMIVQAIQAKPAAGEITYQDGESIPPWATGWIAAAVNNNLMSGYPDNTFRPQANASRAEAATVINKALAARHR